MILCGLAASCATTTVMAQATGNRSSYFLEGSVYRSSRTEPGLSR